MQVEKVQNAIKEAQRFIDAAEKCLAISSERAKEYGVSSHAYGVATSKESGALRRASMDLTRSLAEMRMP